MRCNCNVIILTKLIFIDTITYDTHIKSFFKVYFACQDIIIFSKYIGNQYSLKLFEHLF